MAKYVGLDAPKDLLLFLCEYAISTTGYLCQQNNSLPQDYIAKVNLKIIKCCKSVFFICGFEMKCGLAFIVSIHLVGILV